MRVTNIFVNNKIDLKLKNIAIIGGHGFIGKNFTHFFLEKNYKITLIGNNSSNKTFPVNVQSVSTNVENTELLIEAVKDAEVIIWLASSLIPGSFNESLALDFDTNIKPVVAFLQKAESSVLKKFIYLSSGGTVYGNIDEPRLWQEKDDKSPISEYGLSKLITENYIKFITNTSNFESYILRPSNVYGKFQNLTKPQGIIGFAFKSLIQQSTIQLYDDGKVVRDFIFVDDLAEAVFKCIEAAAQPSTTHIYNVGSGSPVSIKEIVSKIGSVAQKTVQTELKPSRNFDCEFNVLNIDKIKQDLGWEPKIKIDDGLKVVWEWIKQNGNG
ncbi:NAD-dependent epimerase/dehydratase family protein [Kaistella flava (ex Peng et al. 2021)]|uniref:NAD-dependent epimerase/dehydratase family protein n=1 Tax=Kaistella flava (ex Peng et al. 2021) TaxID=2038776 RepID=A0A7M2YAX4_9FLAO|nr:NAD-dependent epimerase/dehydratase family protein [Kaistella flava (ex Peng et al. 2021)]